MWISKRRDKSIIVYSRAAYQFGKGWSSPTFSFCTWRKWGQKTKWHAQKHWLINCTSGIKISTSPYCAFSAEGHHAAACLQVIGKEPSEQASAWIWCQVFCFQLNISKIHALWLSRITPNLPRPLEEEHIFPHELCGFQISDLYEELSYLALYFIHVSPSHDFTKTSKQKKANDLYRKNLYGQMLKALCWN